MIKIHQYSGKPDELASLLVRSQMSYQQINDTVNNIIAAIKTEGDRALQRYSLEFDHAAISDFEVDQSTIRAAYDRTDPALIATLELAHRNISNYHQKQVRHNYFMHQQERAFLGQLVNPIERVGIYIPGGTAAYPSTVLMNAIPAKIAGVKEIVMVSPPNAEGKLPDTVLAAAYIAGVDRVFRVGGAQAIAALAYGTQSIPKVYKIVGPGNVYVAAAKRQVFGQVGIDMFAGPSEILIIADHTARPAFVAADMLSQAEHDTMASAILLTTSAKLAEAVLVELEIQLQTLSRSSIARQSIMDNGRVILVDNIDQACELSNELAPEHLELCVDDPFSYLGLIKNAGSIFMGHYSPEPLGDYMAGPNHTLPTSGTAKFSSALSVDDFVKKSSVIYYNQKSLTDIGDDIIRFANSEGLTAHAAAIKKRLN